MLIAGHAGSESTRPLSSSVGSGVGFRVAVVFVLAFDLAWAVACAPQLLRADPTAAGVDDGGRAASENMTS